MDNEEVRGDGDGNGAQGGGDGRQEDPCGAFIAFFWSLVLFFRPVYMHIRNSHPAFTSMFEYFESVWRDWEQFFSQQPGGFWNVSWEQLLERGRQSRQNVIDYFRSGSPALVPLFQIWFRSYSVMRESIGDLERLHAYIAPQAPGFVPFYDARIAINNISLKELCFRMNINLMQRVYHSSSQFLNHTRNFLSTPGVNQSSRRLRSLPANVQTVPQANVQTVPQANVDEPIERLGVAPLAESESSGIEDSPPGLGNLNR